MARWAVVVPAASARLGSAGASGSRAGAVSRSRGSRPVGVTGRAGQAILLLDALDEDAPAGSLAYLEKLAEVLEDGQVTADEAADLDVVAKAHELSAADVVAANRAFVLALAHEALADGKVTRVERAELKTVAELLAVDAKVLPALLEQARGGTSRTTLSEAGAAAGLAATRSATTGRRQGGVHRM